MVEDGNLKSPDTIVQDPLDHERAGETAALGGAVRAGAIAVGTIISLLGIVFITRALGPAEFGTFQTILNLIAVVAAITEAGMGSVGIREFAQEPERASRRKILQSLLGLRLALASIGIAAAIAISLARGYDAWLVAGTAAAGVGLLGGITQSTLTIPLLSALRYRVISLLELLRPALLTLVYVSLALLATGEFAFLAATIPVQITLVVVLLFVLRDPGLAIPRVERRAWNRFARDNYGLAIASAIGSIYLFATQIVGSFFSTPVENGYFATSLRVYSLAYMIPATIVIGVLPVLSRHAESDPERFRRVARGVADAGLVLSMLLSIGVLTGAGFAISVIGGAAYEPAVDSLRILGFTLLMSGTIAIWAFVHVALRANRALLIANGIALLVSVLLAGLLSGPYGASGTAIATLAGEVLLLVTLGVSVMRLDRGLRPHSRTTVLALLPGLILIGVALLVPLSSVIEMVIFPSAYLISLYFLRAIPAGLVDLVPISASWKSRISRDA
jgi:O-antigen/teichoic acid export membrane protein